MVRMIVSQRVRPMTDERVILYWKNCAVVQSVGASMNFVAAILDFWRPSWIDNGYFIILYSIHGNDHLYQFWYFYQN